MHIVLDANIIIAEGFGNSGSFRALLSTLDDLQYNLYVPKLVIEEVVARFERRLERETQNVVDGLKKLSSHLGRELASPIDALDIGEESAQFRRGLETQLDIPNCSVLEYPDTLHEELVKRATTRRKPFNESGSGYRDALIWESVLRLATTTSSQVALVTADKAFYHAEKRNILHSDLVDDLDTLGLHRDKIILVRSLGDFFSAYIQPNMSEVARDDLLRTMGQPGI